MKKLTRYYIAGAGMDFALYIFFGAIPFYVMSLGGDSIHLGITHAMHYITYISCSYLSGRISDRISRTLLFKTGCLIVFCAWFIVPFMHDIIHVYAVVLVVGFGIGIFWSPMQAAIADESTDLNLERHLGNFNLAWSFGKSMGFLVCGITIAFFKTLSTAGSQTVIALKIPFFLSSFFALVIFMVLPRMAGSAGTQPHISDRNSGDDRTRRKFMIAAWLSNFIAFGLNGLLGSQYPRFAREIMLSELQFNVFLFMVIFCQVLGFLVLMKSTWWQYKKKPLLLVQGGMLVFLLLLPLADRFYLVLLTAPVTGFGFSLAYYSSIYYSLHANHSRGKHAGLHESILGTGNFIFPLAGGVLAAYFGLHCPYVFGFIIGMFVTCIQAYILKDVS